MLRKKKITGKALLPKKKSKADQLRNQGKDLISVKFDRLSKTKPNLKLEQRLGEEIRAYLTRRRKNNFPVEEKMLKSYISQIKARLLKEVTSDK
ncbi:MULTISPECIES: hypothetical protein [Flammeovirga]|uniref:Uncharacterized protein n=1 Tax=Flammeovirga agarivorans TaxID=2726742 RepID=A0A7X8SJW2_9BACT|nr:MULTISPECIES: hypothetical protein [Flammeovirga]NLR91589.1 hypothetical protein [Flammeovirga agarivorans]